jgi:hypothetical protein
MTGRIGLVSMIAAAGLAACGYPDFVFNGSTGAGGHGGQTTTASATTGSTTASTTTGGQTTTTTGTGGLATTSSTTTGTGGQATTTGTGGSPPVCPIDHLLISQVRSRGPAGASDEFVDLFNPTGEDVLLDGSWSIQGRAAADVSYTTRWTGSNKTIPTHGHYLIVGTAYTQDPKPDDMLSEGITDSASLVLQNGSVNVDVLCYSGDSLSEDALTSPILFFTCAGTPASNPHDDTSAGNLDISLDRDKAHGVPECADTGENNIDFSALAPSTPESSMSPPVP